MSQSINNPYVGPGPFSRKDAERFFGRKLETSDLCSLVAAHRTVLLYAQSGAGKSSLINAGLIPGLEKAGYDVFVAGRIAQPAADSAAQNHLQNIFMANAVRPWLTGITAGQDFTANLQTILNGRPRKFEPDDKGRKYPCPRVLIFDQFEEFFTSYPDRWQERFGFFNQLDQAMDAEKGDKLLRVLIAMREDFVAQLDPYENLLPEEFRTRYRLERLRARAAFAAVMKPLEGTNIRFRPKVAKKLVRDLLKSPSGGVPAIQAGQRSSSLTALFDSAYPVEEFVEPVQLQVVCFNLFRNLPAGTTEITEEQLAAYGDVDRALLGFYQDALKETFEQTGIKEDSLREWFEKKLITEAGTRGLVFEGTTTTGGISNKAVKILDEQFHIIRPELRGKDTWYELSHDRFIQPIYRANDDWRIRVADETEKRQAQERDSLTAEARKFRGLSIALGVVVLVAIAAVIIGFYLAFEAKQANQSAEVAQAAAKYAANHENMIAQQLSNANDTVNAKNAELTDEKNQLATTVKGLNEAQSVAHRKTIEAETATQAEKIISETAQSEATRADINAFNYQSAQDDERQLKNAAQLSDQISTSRALAATSSNRISQDPQLALWLAIDSLVAPEPTDVTPGNSIRVTRQSLDALEAAMPAALLVGRNESPCGNIRAVAFSSDNRNVWALDRSGAQIDWDSESTSAHSMGKCLPGIADAEALSPSGKLMAVSGPHRQPSKHPLSELLGVHGKVLLSELSDSAGADPKTTVFPAHGYQPEAIAFSSDDKLLAVAGPWTRRAVFDIEDDRQLWGSLDARVRRLSYRVITLLLGRPPRIVSQIAISPDDQILAVGVEDGIVEFWNINTGDPTGLFLRAHNDPIQGLSFSSNGQLLVTTSRDKSAKIWKIESPKQATLLHELGGHQDAVLCAVFDPSGQRVATGSQDQTIRIWDVATGIELLTLPSQGGYVAALAYSKEGKRLVSGSSDGSLRLWDMSALDDERKFNEKVESVRANAHFDDDVAFVSHSDVMNLLAMAKARVRRNLSPSECAAYFHGAGCPALPQ